MSDNLNINETIIAWADIVIERWEDKIYKLGVNDTYALVESFKHEVMNAAGGDAFKIVFAFNYYGKFSDMGVGKNVPIEKVSESNRRPKPWYGRTFFAEVIKLSEILSDKFSRKGAIMIVDAINHNSINI